jgi:hypothetical protein
MPAHQKNKPDFYLNRLALEEMADLYTKVLKAFFKFDTVQGTIKSFNAACQAALAEEYNWKQGSPGNLVYLYERLEMFLEAYYLIKNKQHKKVRHKKVTKSIKIDFEKSVLPCPLSLEELQDPDGIINQFFDFNRLEEWKRLTHLWMESGISNFSIADNLQPDELLTYYQHIEKLIYAGYWINATRENKRKLNFI